MRSLGGGAMRGRATAWGIAVAALVAGTSTGASETGLESHAQPNQLHDQAHAAQAIDWCIAHLIRREMAQAVSDCDHAVIKEPTNSRAFSTRGAVWLVAGDTKRALQDFEAALVLAPTPMHFYNRGLAHAKAGATSSAIADYTEAIRLNPELAVAFHNRGYEYELLNDLDAALADYRRAVDLAPQLRPAVESLERLRRRTP